MPSTFMQKLLLGVSILLVLLGIALTSVGTFSPAWLIVDIREFRGEHQHGLWWDCVRAEKYVTAVGDFYDEAPLHCIYKFDDSAAWTIQNQLGNIDVDGAAGESVHHQWHPWQKVLLFLIISSECLAFLSMFTGCCAPFFHPSTFVFTFTLFMALLFSLIVDGGFFLYANRVDVRFVTGMVGTYEQRVGYAFYVHLLGTVCWLLAFVCALLTSYKFLTSGGKRKLFDDSTIEYQCRPDLAQEKPEWQRPLAIGHSRASPRMGPRVYSNTQV